MSQVIVRMDSSQLVQFAKCPTQWYNLSVRNIVRKHVDKSAMDRGTVFHGLAERYYTKVWERDQSATAYAIGELNNLKKTVILKDEDYTLLTLRFLDYTTKYFKDSLEIETVVDPISGVKKPAIELGFSVPILDTKDFLFVLEGRIDMIVRMSGSRVIWDHKVQGRRYSLYGQSIQSLNYCLAADSKMFLYNYIRLHAKVQPDTFYRQLTYVRPGLLEKWRAKLIKKFHAVATYKELRDNNPEFNPYFPDSPCADIGFGKICPYTQLCEEPSSRIQDQLVQLNYQVKKAWEPWSLEEEGD